MIESFQEYCKRMEKRRKNGSIARKAGWLIVWGGFFQFGCEVAVTGDSYGYCMAVSSALAAMLQARNLLSELDDN